MSDWLDLLTVDGTVIPAWRSIKGLAGSPPPKADTRDKARRHGVTDYTKLYQARIIELDDAVLKGEPGSIYAALDELKGAFALGSDHVLRFRRTGMAEDERVVARVAGELTAVLDYASRGVLLWSVPLLVADPRIYSDTLNVASYQPSSGGTGGLAFPLSFPLTFSADPSSSLLQVENGGNFPTPPVWTITGPVVNPEIVDETTGEALFTTQLELLAGEQVTIDVAARDVLINGTSRPDVIDAAHTTWGELAKGVNVVRLLGTGMSAASGTELSVAFRDARI